MTDPITILGDVPREKPALYSQTPTDDRGKFVYKGDLLRPNESFAVLCARIVAHLRDLYPDFQIALTRQSFAGGRKIKVEICDTPIDLRDPAARDPLLLAVRDQIERFGFARANFHQDYSAVSFYSEVAIGKAYWAALAARVGQANPVEPSMSLAQFKRAIKVGDTLTMKHAPWQARYLGIERMVDAVRSGDIIMAGSYLTLPCAAEFACDGRQVRIAVGDASNPDAHLLYIWTRHGG